MATTKFTARLTAIAAASALLFSGSAVAASGSTAPSPDGGSVMNTPAPNCVKVIDKWRDGTSPHVAIRNDCKGSQRVKVLWAFGGDSECAQLARGEAVQSSSGAFATFDGIVKC